MSQEFDLWSTVRVQVGPNFIFVKQYFPLSPFDGIGPPFFIQRTNPALSPDLVIPGEEREAAFAALRSSFSFLIRAPVWVRVEEE